MNSETLVLPTPHRDKLEALLENRRLPSDDRGQVEEALRRYGDWIGEIETVGKGQRDAVQRLVEATNRYRNFIDLDLIFDSRQDFLYQDRCSFFALFHRMRILGHDAGSSHNDAYR